MPENNERFNYQSELLRGERYHSLPLATEDLSNLRRFAPPIDTIETETDLSHIIIRQGSWHFNIATPMSDPNSRLRRRLLLHCTRPSDRCCLRWRNGIGSITRSW